MCRMIAVASADPVDGTEYLARLASLSRSGNLVDGWERHPGGSHPDGWGVAYLSDGGIRLVRSGLPACSDPEIGRTRFSSRRFIGHVRYASNVSTRNAANSHPFVISGIALAHNGTFRGRIGAEAEGRGVSDTLVFLEILAGLWQERVLVSLREALSEILGDPDRVGDYSAANLLIVAGGRVFAARKCRRNEAYYSLFLKAGKGLVEAASEPPADGKGWEPIRNGILYELDPGSPCSIPLT